MFDNTSVDFDGGLFIDDGSRAELTGGGTFADSMAIDMLPSIGAAPSAKRPKSADRPGDSCGSDFNRQIPTYSNAEKAGNRVFSAMPGNEKAPVSQRKTGAEMYGAPETLLCSG